MKRALIFLAVVVGLWQWTHPAPIRHPAGILAPDAPKQEALASAQPFDRNGHRIIPLASFRLKARVLSVSRYRFDRESKLAPIDLALGWGPMSDQAIIDQIKISQSFRWYHWRTDREPPIPEQDITAHSANMHVIPSRKEIENRLKAVRAGHVVELSGYLVEITAADGWQWKSSLSRTDTGNRSCEVVWVETLDAWP